MGSHGHGARAERLRRLGGPVAAVVVAVALLCGRVALLCGGVALLCGGVAFAATASVSGRQLQVIGRAAAFLQPIPAGGTIAVVFDPANPASRRDAAAIVAEIGGGMPVAGRTMPARAVPVAQLAGGGFAIAIAAAGSAGPALGAAIRAAHVLCVTSSLAAVQAGFCTMAVSTDLRVQIVLNHAAAAQSGINFVAAFRMMIREI